MGLLIGIDGFDHHNIDQTFRKYDLRRGSSEQGEVNQGRFYDSSLAPFDRSRLVYNTSFDILWYEWYLGSAQTEVTIMFDLKCVGSDGTAALFDSDIFQISTGTGTTFASGKTRQCVMLVSTDGSIYFYLERTGRNFDFLSLGTDFDVLELGHTAPGVVVAGVWATYQVSMNLSTDTILLKKNGSTIGITRVSDSGQVLSGTSTYAGFVYNSFNTAGPQIDNLVITAGGLGSLGLNKVFTGWPKVDFLREWNPSATGNHFSLVNDKTVSPNYPDSDTTYVHTDVNGAQEIYYVDSVASSGTLPGVQVCVCARSVDTTYDGSIQVIAQAPDNTVYLGSALAIHSADSSDYRFVRQVWQLDPSGAPWSGDNIALWKFGFKNTSLDGKEIRVTQLAVEFLNATGGVSAAARYRILR